MKNLKAQLEKVSAFMQPESLAQQNLRYDGEVALLVIDVQDTFCNPNRDRGTAATEEIATRIQSVSPAFREAGIPVYAIYFSYDKPKNPADIDFYKFTPVANDTLVRKTSDSAFDGSDIEQTLKKDGRKLLLTCGFNLNACVVDTVMDARRLGFEVCLLEDLTGNDAKNDPEHAPRHLKAMHERGVTMENAANALSQIKAHKLACTGA